MRTLFQIAIAATVALGAAGAATAGELPTYEAFGLPITPVQMSILGSAHVREQSPVPTLTVAGMPASPHQVAVLTPGQHVEVAEGQ